MQTRLIAITLMLFSLLSFSSAVHAANDNTTYNRVMSSKTLRCGYLTWPPYFEKDSATGKSKGMWFDYMEAFGRAFDIKVEWVAETSMTDIPTALNSNKIDAFCLPLGAVPTRAVNMEFSRPIIYYPFFAYVRKDDARFDNNLAAIDNEKITLSTMEGEYTGILARTTFPKAKLLEITETQGNSTLFINVVNKKADVIFQDPGTFKNFDKSNKDKLRKAKNGFVGGVPGGFIVKLGDNKMKRLFDYGITDLENRLITKRLVDQYGFSAKVGKDADLLMPTLGYQAN